MPIMNCAKDNYYRDHSDLSFIGLDKGIKYMVKNTKTVLI